MTRSVKYVILNLTKSVNIKETILKVESGEFMYESFENLEEAKKQSIINAGFKIFAEDGYKKASVDAIIQEANISKGSLFYYFGSKKNFFLYLYEYCGEQMKKLIDNPDSNGLPNYMQNTDFFDRIKEIQKIKIMYEINYPHMYKFMKRAAFETDPAVKNEIAKYNQQVTLERVTDFFQNLDLSKFRDGVDPKMVMQLVIWCTEGIANLFFMREKMKPENQRELPDFKEMVGLYESYMELLKNNFYKEEYLK